MHTKLESVKSTNVQTASFHPGYIVTIETSLLNVSFVLFRENNAPQTSHLLRQQ